MLTVQIDRALINYFSCKPWAGAAEKFDAATGKKDSMPQSNTKKIAEKNQLVAENKST
jgi:hypothetical protein